MKLIELYTSIVAFEQYRNGETIWAHNSLDAYKGNHTNVVKIILPFEAVEYEDDGIFRILVKGLEY